MSLPRRFVTVSRVLVADLLRSSYSAQSDRCHLNEAIEWLYRSQDVTDCAGSSASYNLILGWQGPYPETTGYIASTLFEHARLYHCEESRKRAISMCDWLLSTQLKEGGFPGGTNPTPESAMNVFNTGQIVLGLVDAYQETGNREYKSAVERACRWLVDEQAPMGYWNSFDYKAEVHSYTSRIAWSLLRGWEVTGIDDFRTAALSNIQWVITQQTPNSWFRDSAFVSGDKPFLHTIAYTIRGLLESSRFLEDSLGFREAKRAADTLLDIQKEQGPLRGAYSETWDGVRYYCLTGNAQVATIWLRLFDLTGESHYHAAARQEIDFLKTIHRLTGPPEIRGGLKGSHPIWGKYMYLRYPNWATKFLVDAIMKIDSMEDPQ